MRILHVHENLVAAGGIETYLLSLIPRLEALGHECGYVYAEGQSDLVAQSFRVPDLSSSSPAGRRPAASAVQSILNTWQPDVVHLHNVYNTAAIDACLRGAPTVLTAHDYRYACPASTFYFKRTEGICDRTCGLGCAAVTLTRHCLTPRPRKAWQYIRRVQWMQRNWDRFAHLIAPSGAALARFAAAGFPSARSSVLPYYCPIEPMSDPRPRPAQTTLLFLGRITPLKGYRYFIEALGKLSSDVRGIIVGSFNTEKRRELGDIAAACGCSERLELRSWADRCEIVRLMQSATVLCFPSIWPETLGIVGLEAMACGVPVVACDVGGVREWLHHGENGLLVPPRDADAMADAVRQIIGDTVLLDRMGYRGLEVIRSRFSPDRHLTKLLDVYSAASDRKPTGQRTLPSFAT